MKTDVQGASQKWRRVQANSFTCYPLAQEECSEVEQH